MLGWRNELKQMSPEELQAYLALNDHKERCRILDRIKFLEQQNSDLFKEIDKLTQENWKLTLTLEEVSSRV